MNHNFIFLDRDGVINEDFGYVYKWEDFVFIDGVIEALKILSNLNFKFIIITNQSGIGRGYFTEKEYLDLTKKYLEFINQYGIKIQKVYYCPYAPISKEDNSCFSRKPNPGMILDAVKDYNIDLNKSFMVGDKISDIFAAKNAGIKKTYLISEDCEKINSVKKIISGNFKSLFALALYLESIKD